MRSTKLVVVVDDNPDMQRLLRLYVERMGLDVVVFSDGSQALEKIETLRPDLVCLDLMLPYVSGFDVCEAIKGRADFRHIPVLITSARAMPGRDEAYAERAGADAYLVKPFVKADFISVVHRLLQHAHPPLLRAEEEKSVSAESSEMPQLRKENV